MSAAAGSAAAAELRLSELPENSDFILLLNEAFDDGGADVVDAVDVEAGGGALSPVRLPNEEHAVSIATATAATASRQPQHRAGSAGVSLALSQAGWTPALPEEAFAVSLCKLRLSISIMRNLVCRAAPL
jgi:hypothetical protein